MGDPQRVPTGHGRPAEGLHGPWATHRGVPGETRRGSPRVPGDPQRVSTGHGRPAEGSWVTRGGPPRVMGDPRRVSAGRPGDPQRASNAPGDSAACAGWKAERELERPGGAECRPESYR